MLIYNSKIRLDECCKDLVFPLDDHGCTLDDQRDDRRHHPSAARPRTINRVRAKHSCNSRLWVLQLLLMLSLRPARWQLAWFRFSHLQTFQSQLQSQTPLWYLHLHQPLPHRYALFRAHRPTVDRHRSSSLVQPPQPHPQCSAPPHHYPTHEILRIRGQINGIWHY